MKIRVGFVSNSSSSSFVIFGNKIKKSEIKDHEHVWIIGSEYGEGTDAFELTDEVKDAILSYKGHMYADFVAAIKTMWTESSSERLTKEDLKAMLALGEVEVISFEKSHYDSFEQGDWEERYLR
jgi:hypothetical protein